MNASDKTTIDFFYDDYFNGKEGHTYTDKEIHASASKMDIDDCLEDMRIVLYTHFGIEL